MSYFGRPLVAGAGMVTAVGLDAPSTCAAIRAGISPFDETHFHATRGDQEPIIGAQVTGLGDGLFETERLAAFLARAVLEALDEGGAGGPGAVPVFVGVAEPGGPGFTGGLPQEILPALAEALGGPLHPLSRCIAAGKASFVGGVEAAAEAARSHGIRRSVVAGVDTYLDGDVLRHFEKASRVKTVANSNGFIPGEAAACVMLDFADADADAPASGREGAAPVTAPVRLLGLGAGTESAVIGSGRPLRADGMAGAVRAGMRDAGVTFADLHFRLSDVNGENYGFRENALAMSRVLRDSKPTFPLWHCADSLGEVGAASGAALVAFGRDAIARGYAPGERALGMLSADSGPRGAFVLGPAPRGEGN